MNHPNVTRIEEFLDDYAAGDTAAVGARLGDDIVWRVGGQHRLSGQYRGRQAVIDYFDAVSEETKGTLALEPIEILANDRHGAAFLRVTGERPGQQLDTVMAEAFTFDGEGRITEFWATASDQSAIDRFWEEGQS